MKSLETVHFSNCIDQGKDGLTELIEALITNRDTLRYVDISGNDWNKNVVAAESVQDFIIKGIEIQHLNISNIGLEKQECEAVIDTLLNQIRVNWCLDNNVRELIWDGDLKCNQDKAVQFIEKELMTSKFEK